MAGVTFGFETVDIEYLGLTRQSPQGSWIKRRLKEALLKRGFVKSDLSQDRCVFHLIYRGYDAQSFQIAYWEKEHDDHTKHGF